MGWLYSVYSYVISMFFLDRILFVARTMYSIIVLASSKGAHKRVVDPAVEHQVLKPWPTPQPLPSQYGNHIIWGYWHSGEENMPAYPKLCVSSWRAKHPKWSIIILSESNFKKYVSVDQLPSTYYSLMCQHQCDIVRTAVLLRYGGVYLDVSTMCFKAFDAIMDDVNAPKVMFPQAVRLTNGISFPNNAVIISREANNVLLKEWHQRMLKYHEKPAKDEAEMAQSEDFKRVIYVVKDKRLEVVKGLALYMCNLLLLCDVIWTGMPGYAAKHLRYLPHKVWGLADYSSRARVERLRNEPTSLNLSNLLLGTWLESRAVFEDDKQLADEIHERVAVMKSSLDICWQKRYSNAELIRMKSTYGRLIRKALDGSKIEQATVEGSRSPVTVA